MKRKPEIVTDEDIVRRSVKRRVERPEWCWLSMKVNASTSLITAAYHVLCLHLLVESFLTDAVLKYLALLINWINLSNISVV